MSEDRFTGKLRVWFNGGAVVKEPKLYCPLPWKIVSDCIYSTCGDKAKEFVARVYAFEDAEHIVNAANKHHALSTVVATVYNRIRLGDVLFDGSEADVRLWQEAKKLLEV